MKAASPSLIAYLAQNDQHLYADLFSFVLADGTVLSFTDKDIPLTVDGTLYRADQVRFDGMRYKVAVGLDVDEQTIALAYGPNDLVDGVSWGQALRTGVLDGCYLRRSRAFYDAWNLPPVGVVPLFAGRVSTVDQVGRVEAQVRIKSTPLLLDTLMPRNTYQTGCIHGLFDVGCGLAKASYAMTWSVASGPTSGTIPVPSGTPPLPAALAGNTEGLGIFVQGTILFTSGANEGVYRTIKGISAAVEFGLDLVYPLETPPAPGDSFTIWPGCDKTALTCTARFANLGRFRGFPYTPAAETAY
jgi:uncharacterized phage protein (TIGR02218 family)